MAQLSGWSNFYVIVGSSAGALIGLQFVVIALVSSLRPETAAGGARAYATPTVTFFATVLLTSALLSIPHQTRGWLVSELLSIGLIGTLYVMRVSRHIRVLEAYTADKGDWAWFLLLPLTAFVAMFASGVVLWSKPGAALDIAAGSALLLLFVGVHNAWDGAVYMVTTPRSSQTE